MKPFLSDRPRSTTPVTLDATLSTATATFATALSPASSRAAHTPHAGHGGSAAPHVEAIRQGDKITRLVVTCSCGERIEIDCLYATGA